MTKEELAAKMRAVCHSTVDSVTAGMKETELDDKAVILLSTFAAATVFAAMCDAANMPDVVILSTLNQARQPGGLTVFADIVLSACERVEKLREENAS